MSSTVEIKETKNCGRGLFTKQYFDPNLVILKFTGKLVHKKDIQDVFYSYDPKIQNYLQIGSELYLNLEGENPYFINHSCEPNCVVKIQVNTAFLVSIRPIQIGEELTFDYSTTSTENPLSWQMDCSCDSKYTCRKFITGFASLTESEKAKYLAINAVPGYVLKK